MRYITGLIVVLMFWGCGGASDAAPGNSMEVIDVPEGSPCQKGEFYQIKTHECIALKHPTWGFTGFDIAQENRYVLQECSEDALRALLGQLPAEGGHIVLPACTLKIANTIGLYDNTILEGAGVGKTVITGTSADLLSLRGRNIIVRGMTLDGANKALGGVVCTNNRGNLLIENLEIKNLNGSGIYLVTSAAQADTQITIRQNTISRTLHGIVVKTLASAKMLIYSNQLYDNREYGIDVSTTSDVEISGNYMHNNYYAGAKTPLADRIYYYHNSINYNGKGGSVDDRAGIVYMGSSPGAKIYIEYNDLRDNNGLAYASWSADFDYLLLRENLVTGSQDSNGYTIRATGIQTIDVYGDHGKIWVGYGNEDRIVYH